MMLHVPDVLTPDEVAAMRGQLLASEQWVDGRATVGAQGAQVKRNLQLDDQSPLRHQLAEQVLAALGRSPLFFAAALPLHILTPLFNRYRDGGTYGFHVDGAMLRQPDNRICARTCRARCSCASRTHTTAASSSFPIPTASTRSSCPRATSSSTPRSACTAYSR